MVLSFAAISRSFSSVLVVAPVSENRRGMKVITWYALQIPMIRRIPNPIMEMIFLNFEVPLSACTFICKWLLRGVFVPQLHEYVNNIMHIRGL